MSEYAGLNSARWSRGKRFRRYLQRAAEHRFQLDSQLRSNLGEWDGAAQQAYYAAKTQGTTPWPTWRAC